MKYKELLYDGDIYTEKIDIEDILIKNKMSWFINNEFENIRIEIQKGVLIINAGTWYNGIFEYGAIRNIDWRAGTFKNGVWFNGTWKTGLWESGIIFNGTFLNGDFMNVIIRKIDQKGNKTNPEFNDCNITNIKKI